MREIIWAAMLYVLTASIQLSGQRDLQVDVSTVKVQNGQASERTDVFESGARL